MVIINDQKKIPIKITLYIIHLSSV